MEIRSFLAFELPDRIGNMVAQVSDELKRHPLDIRWVKAANMHLTVLFMGSVLGENIEKIEEEAAMVCQEYGPFNIRLKSIGTFGGKHNPRVLWIGLDGDMGRLTAFRDTIQKHLAPFGVKEEKRPFKPHLTLGRFRKKPNQSDLDETLSRWQDLSSQVCDLKELILFKSELKPSGAVHTRLNVWSLTGNR